ncbi:hypothetical protein [Vibrio metoecus]|uniref:hypothetical protein n=1 Tax=Vibrio metoecus TaxID=1481663 RepID=UPI000BA8F2E9|nr:hypothetical protein [Vibrio metoecus]PAR35802.1 hypothetical protein CGT97_09540 [Vibrio metoecus]PAR44126.1 hypothetical protein CGT96_04220 [Vibrio metoecus]PAR54004.1 hypothetical protein CGT93_10120 [Vibrio metoecus]
MSILSRRSPFKARLLGGSSNIKKYAPQFDGLTQFIQLSSPWLIGASDDFEISVVASGLTPSSFQSVFSGSSIENFMRTLNAGGGIQCYVGNFIASWTTSGFDVEAEHKYTLRRTGGIVSVIVDDEVKSTRNGSVNGASYDRFMRSWTTSAFSTGMIKSASFELNGQLVSSFNFNQRNSAIQNPTVGAITATIINHTNAMWVEV